MPLDKIGREVLTTNLPRNVEIVVYCGGPKSAELVVKLGGEKVLACEGGLEEWKAAGSTVEEV